MRRLRESINKRLHKGGTKKQPILEEEDIGDVRRNVIEESSSSESSYEESNEHLNMEGKVCIVTGATGALGFETCKKLADLGATLIMACRDTAKGKELAAEIIEDTGNDDVQVMKLDLSSIDSVERFANKFLQLNLPLHVLINNAGVINCPNEITENGFDNQFQINYLGPFVLTNLLLERMIDSAPARILNVSALFHLIGKFNPENMKGKMKTLGMTSFCNSKFALVEFSYELSKRLEGSGVTVNVVDPIISATGGIKHASKKGVFKNLFGPLQNIGISPEKAAESFVKVATAPEFEKETGEYFVNGHPMKWIKRSYDPAKANYMWNQTKKMLDMQTIV